MLRVPARLGDCDVARLRVGMESFTLLLDLDWMAGQGSISRAGLEPAEGPRTRDSDRERGNVQERTDVLE
jgi:hypothetical protein